MYDGTSIDLAGPWPAAELIPVTEYPTDGPPAMRLNEARAAQVTQLWERRAAALDAAAADPSLRAQVEAERAIDDAVANRLDDADRRVQTVLGYKGATEELAQARAIEASARVYLWRSYANSASRGSELMYDAISRYERLGSREWAGGALFWIGNSAHFQLGELEPAERLMRQALAMLAPGSQRRGYISTFLADLLAVTGRWPEFDVVMAEVAESTRPGDGQPWAYYAWSRAKGASARGDQVATSRWLAEVERNVGEWFGITTGATFLGDAAAMLERVGDSDKAREYLTRAADRDPDDEFVRMAEAELLARSGNPDEALRALRAVSHQPWLEVLQQWRMTLLTAWSLVRTGRAGEAAGVAARAFAQADRIGGPAVARTGEPRLSRLLAPLAAREGSTSAATSLAPSGVLLQLLGRATLTRDGTAETLPSGLPGKLLRLVAVHEHGIDAEQVVELLWPETTPADGRRLLRVTLSRLRGKLGDVITRDGEQLLLAEMWVDLRSFRVAADEALAERRADVVLAALALWTGGPLPTDRYEDWALAPRDHLVRRRLRLLDLAADLLPERAEAFVEQAIEEDPGDASRYERLAQLLDERGRPAAAHRWRARADEATRE